ncbi:MAG: DedA family protein [Ignavibacteriales bacterium]|nr:DedA family protein [Ignavibacteriales bacterium]
MSAWLRRLKSWVEGFAQKPGAAWSLFGIAFIESSFFPIPPDVLLIALAVSVPAKSFRYALVCSVGSVLGGMLGYFIGLEFYDLVGRPIIDFYGLRGQYLRVQQLYSENAFTAIAVAGFTPIPYKVFTIAAGAFHVSFATLVYASILSRSARFFLVAALFYWFGAGIKSFVDKYLESLSVAFVVLLILGFLAIRWLI